MLSLSGNFKHLFRLVVHLLSFRRSVLGDVTVVVVEFCWTSRRLHISSAAAVDYSSFPVGIAVRTLLFGRNFARFEDLGVVQVGVKSAELVDLLRLAQVLNE